MDINIMLCNHSDTLRDALNIINENGKGTAFIVDADQVLQGIITDGDIRRILLKTDGMILDEPVVRYMNKKFVSANMEEDIEPIIHKFDSRIQLIPIVNDLNQVVDVYEYINQINIPIAQPELNGNELKYLMDAFLSTWISSTGSYIKRFEEGFAEFCGVHYGIATSNGTTALHLALITLGIGQGDEVIVPDITFAATINAVLFTGATPVIVDVEEDSWCISPDEIEKAVTEKTKAIIPVHIYGQPCDMNQIMNIAQRYDLYIIEDCAEAHGAEYGGKKVGSFGHIGCFSFFANKVITTGEGGMCVTNSKLLEEKMRILRDHGMSKEKKYYHEMVGYNYRMTNLQAAIGVAQLEKIDDILDRREKLEEFYYEILKDIDEINFQNKRLPNRRKITWLVTILLPEEKRDLCMKELKARGIDVRPFFIPLSEMDIYKKYTYSNVNSKRLSARGINLPTSVDVKENMIEKVKEILKGIIEERDV